MKNDYNATSMSASGKRKGKIDSDDEYDESSAFQSESNTVTGSVDKKFEYLRQKYLAAGGAGGLGDVSDTSDEDDSDDDSDDK